MTELAPEVLVPNSVQELRAQGPVCWRESHGGFWVAWKYREVSQILTDSARFSSRQTLEQALRTRRAAAGMGALPRELDAPLHGQYRRLLTGLIASASQHAGKSLVASTVAEELSAPRPDGTPFMAGFAVPVITKVIFRFTGLPAEDEAMFVEQAHSFLRSSELDAESENRGPARANVSAPASNHSWVTEDQLRAGSRLQEYVAGLVADARPREPGGLLGLLMSASWRTHFGSAGAEAAAMLTDFIESGLLNTTLSLRSGISHLAANRDDRQTLLACPALAPRMTDELLRLDHLSFPARTVRRDTRIADAQLRVGDVVMAAIGLANRDETVFEHPDRVMLERPNRRQHLAFGAGPHYCLGAPLAHEILTASFASLEAILRRFARPDG